MNLWMDVMRDIEHLMGDYQRIFDGWQEGGVTGMVIGPPVFHAEQLTSGTTKVPREKPPVPIFDPNHEVYRRFGVEPPPDPEEKDPGQRALLREALQAAKDRGFCIFFFQAQVGAGPGGTGHALFDPKSRAATSARITDCLEQYPMVDGAIMDGPEWGYEISAGHMDHRSYIFNDLPEDVRDGCSQLGYDYEALVAAKDRLFDRLHRLEAKQIGLHAGGGFLGAFHLLGSDPGVAAWMAFRADSLTKFFRTLKEELADKANRPIQLGVGPRTAAFAPLCGYDFARLGQFMDLLLPKHYFWHRGFDGLVGTVDRYVETLCQWNAGLCDADALKVIEALFGLSLPAMETRSDLDQAHTPAFWWEIVGQETRRALAAVEDPLRIVPWVDAGPRPHDGDPICADDLRRLLQSAEDAGLQRFLYHHHGNLTPAEWTVMSEFCGNRWDPNTSAYAPPDEKIL